MNGPVSMIPLKWQDESVMERAGELAKKQPDIFKVVGSFLHCQVTDTATLHAISDWLTSGGNIPVVINSMPATVPAAA